MPMVLQETRNAAGNARNVRHNPYMLPLIRIRKDNFSVGDIPAHRCEVGQLVAFVTDYGFGWYVRVSEDLLIFEIEPGQQLKGYTLVNNQWRAQDFDEGVLEVHIRQWRVKYIDHPASAVYNPLYSKQYLYNAFPVTADDIRIAVRLVSAFKDLYTRVGFRIVTENTSIGDTRLVLEIDGLLYSLLEFKTAGTNYVVIQTNSNGVISADLSAEKMKSVHLHVAKILDVARDELHLPIPR